MEHHPREEELFTQALDLPEASRADFLQRRCRHDAALRRRVAALLQAHADAANFLETRTPFE